MPSSEQDSKNFMVPGNSFTDADVNSPHRALISKNMETASLLNRQYNEAKTLGFTELCFLQSIRQRNFRPFANISELFDSLMANDIVSAATINVANGDTKRIACVVCLDKTPSVLFLPCKHFVICDECNHNISDSCPFCRQMIRQKIVGCFLPAQS